MATDVEKLLDGTLTQHIPFSELIDVLQSTIGGQVLAIMITDQVFQNEADPENIEPFTRYHAKSSAEYVHNIEDITQYRRMTLASLKRDVLKIAQATRSGNIDANIITLCVRYTCILLSKNLLSIGLSEKELAILKEYEPVNFPQKLKETYYEYYTVFIALLLVLERYGTIYNDGGLCIHLDTMLLGIINQTEEQFGTGAELIADAKKLIDE